MRFSTYINNQKSIEWGLNASQAALFDLLNQASSWAGEIVIDGAVFYWVSRGSVIQELPLFYSKSDTVYRHFVDLSKKGLIVYLKHGEKDLIRLTEKGKTWNEFKTEQIRNSSEIDPTDNNTNYKNTTDQNNKKTTQKSESEMLLEQFGISGQLAKDFIAHRKSKRAAITKTVLVGYQREAHKAEIPLAKAITISIERNWQGFKAEWNWRDDNIATATNTRKTSAFADDGSWAVGRKLNIDPELIPEELR